MLKSAFEPCIPTRGTTVPAGLARRSDGIYAAPYEQGEIGSDLFRHACIMGLEVWCRSMRSGQSLAQEHHPAYRRVQDQF
jgi:hypothetical protein